MAGLTTIALLEKRTGISSDLFSRYWRDVHGVMAARIPGFESYVQFHVTRIRGGSGEPVFDGIAVVTFATEADRAGLAQSAISAQIVRDEPNVFDRALLYNLSASDSVRLNPGAAKDRDRCAFALFDDANTAREWAGKVAAAGNEVHLHDISGADPSLWNGFSADTISWCTILQYWPDGGDHFDPDASATVYRTDMRCVMVEGGRPTPLGLRGADALRTIEEAGATNQLDRQVEELIYFV